MAKYIKLEDLMKFPIRRNHYDKKHGNEHFIYGIETVLEYAENLPAADVAPVVHGRWISKNPHGYEWTFVCSNCGYVDGYHFNDRHNYCPNCGAKMESEG